MLDALEQDWEGYEELRLRCSNRVPKYGNDEELPDGYAVAIARLWGLEVEKYRNVRGGRFIAGAYSMTTHQGFGKFLGALPNGRRAFGPLADNISPSSGLDRAGPTAAMRSLAKLDYRLLSNGTAYNQRLHPGALSGESGTRALSALVQAFFAMGGMHVQYNVIDRETLLEAQEHPERHQGLLVRVVGYSAYFNDLDREVQDEIIARTEHAF